MVDLAQNPYLLALFGAAIGALLTFLVQRIMNKRAGFSYLVDHERVGVSADDAVMGSVRVLWNGNEMGNLWVSTVRLLNESLRDFEKVNVRVYSSDTLLLTQRTGLTGTTDFPRLTEEYEKKVAVAPGDNATEEQINLMTSHRDYRLEVFNRGQEATFSFLNAAKNADRGPSLWLDVVHKGVKLRYRKAAPPEVFGVPQPSAALVGAASGLVAIPLLIAQITSLPIAVALAFLYGLFAQLPGVLAIKAWRRFRAVVGD